jgi:hypothetical protein
LLLWSADAYPGIREYANKVVSDFKREERFRVKKEVPNLGEFLIYLTLSKVEWKDIAILFLKEMFDRNVRIGEFL